MHKNNKGFTLIELLVVIAIIGLLSTLAVVALNNAREKARDARRLSDVKQIQTALELYYNDANMYPAAITTLSPLAYSGTSYMASVPTSPQPVDNSDCSNNSNYSYTGLTSAVNVYSGYLLTYCLGGAVGQIGPGPETASPAGISL